MKFIKWIPGSPVLLLLFLPIHGVSQEQPREDEEPLRVFLDCWRCDMDYFRMEVPFVSYVRDRKDAEVHVLVTSQETGAGGSEYTFNFIGLGTLSARNDTLTVASRPDDTDDETREDLARVFKLGLVPFLAPREIARRMDVTFHPSVGGKMPTGEELEDPWDLWVFNVRVGGELDGASRESSASVDGSFSASRTTEKLKMDFRASGNWDRDRFEYDEGDEETFTSRNYEIEGLSVWSLTPHWSWGVTGATSGATRYNQDLTIRGGPAVEYNYFPYSESTRRQITFLYRVEAVSFNYEEITIFEKTSETRLTHKLEIGSAFNQPWGELDLSLQASNYLDDFSQHRIEFFSRFEIRLFRGLSLDVQGNAARVKDQIYQPLEDIPLEDILLRRRELGTDYEYGVEIGFNFTFGSVFNNVVNPRMSSGGGPGRWGGH